MDTKSFSVFLFLMFSLTSFITLGHACSVGFYSDTCPNVEKIVRSTVAKHLKSNPRIAPGILRMHFHDCFVRGCDASILIEGSDTEKTAPPNRGIPGYDVIDDAKAQLEEACPGVVSCADIVALAARDSVVLTKGYSWEVPTGRKDGRVSRRSDVSNLPSFRESIESQLKKFNDKGLNTALDLVVLVGGHTIGTTACTFFSYRLYNFSTETPTGADPTIDPSFVPILRELCPEGGDGSRRVALDTGSVDRFDLSYFNNLRKGQGILESDQKLWTDSSTQPIVQQFLTGKLNFNLEFGKSMVKMGNIGVKTGDEGEIRKVCTAIN